MNWNLNNIAQGFFYAGIPSSLSEGQRAQVVERYNKCLSAGSGEDRVCEYLKMITSNQRVRIVPGKGREYIHPDQPLEPGAVYARMEVPTDARCAACGCMYKAKIHSPGERCPIKEAILPNNGGKLQAYIGNVWRDVTAELTLKDDVRIHLHNIKDAQHKTRIRYRYVKDGVESNVEHIHRWDKMV